MSSIGAGPRYRARNDNTDSTKMHLILSRKGFDSSAGGCPSPIFPDGSLYALPISDPKSGIRYREINHAGHCVGDLVEDLTQGKIRADMGAHLDPDMHPGDLSRTPGWRPLLGQTGAAQGHLRRRGVQAGDLFLFFGLFRPVEQVGGHWRFVKGAAARHILWGWLSIGEIIQVDALKKDELPWARYHPHFAIGPDTANTLYLAADRLTLHRDSKPQPGAGVFPRLAPQLQLTRPDAPSPTAWRLPRFLYPEKGRAPLSYHSRPERWSLNSGDGDHCHLQCAARGQEFVLPMNDYPEVAPWLEDLIGTHGSGY